MIRIQLGEERNGPGEHSGRRHGVFHWTCGGYGVEGFSRQPLLDACRAVKRMGALPAEAIGLFRGDRCDMSCSVEWGAVHTVNEHDTRFVKWRPFRESDNARIGNSR